MELRRFIDVIWKRLWLVILATVLTGGMTFLLSIRATPIYQATTTLEIDPGGDPRTDLYSVVRTSEMVAGTFVEQIRAPVLLRQVSRNLGVNLSLDQLQSMITAEQIRDTQLIRISAELSDPLLAQALAEMTAQVFIEREMGQQRARFEAGLAELEAQITALEASIDQTHRAVAFLGDPTDPQNERIPDFARLELARLNSQLASDQTRLVIQLRSAEDFRLAMARYTDFVTVFSPAELPRAPVRPRVMLNTVLGLISGLVLGVSTAFVLEYLDDTIRSPEDVKRALPVGVLGAIPHLGGSDGRVAPVVAQKPLSPVAEAFRNLRTSVQFSTVDEPARTLLVTSPLASDGKTFTVVNLATVMAQAGLRVIALDTDMRRPLLHKAFGLANDHGLSDAILHPISDVMSHLQATEVYNLSVLPSGPLPPNPAEVLGSHTFRELLDRLTDRADVVVLDSPPVLAVTDAAVLSAVAEGTLLVVNCGETRLSAASDAFERLTSVGARVLGVVLNRLSPSRDGYYYYAYAYRGDRGYREGDGGPRRNGPFGWIKSLSRRGRRRKRPSQDGSSTPQESAETEVQS